MLTLRFAIGAKYESGLDLNATVNMGKAKHREKMQQLNCQTVQAQKLRNLLRDIFESRITSVDDLQDFLNADDSVTGTETVGMPSAMRADTMPREKPAGHFYQPNALETTSRYRAEFEEVESLGQGGFGQVVKARNKLDSNF